MGVIAISPSGCLGIGGVGSRVMIRIIVPEGKEKKIHKPFPAKPTFKNCWPCVLWKCWCSGKSGHKKRTRVTGFCCRPPMAWMAQNWKRRKAHVSSIHTEGREFTCKVRWETNPWGCSLTQERQYLLSVPTLVIGYGRLDEEAKFRVGSGWWEKTKNSRNNTVTGRSRSVQA